MVSIKMIGLSKKEKRVIEFIKMGYWNRFIVAKFWTVMTSVLDMYCFFGVHFQFHWQVVTIYVCIF